MFSATEAAPVTVPRLELVKKAGEIYAQNYCIPKELLEDIKTPMIPEEQYASGTELINWGHCGIYIGEGNIIHAWDKVRIDDTVIKGKYF